MVLLNRRGYAPLLYCLDCKGDRQLSALPHRPDLSQGTGEARLPLLWLCHPFPSPCPQCRSMNFLPMGKVPKGWKSTCPRWPDSLCCGSTGTLPGVPGAWKRYWRPLPGMSPPSLWAPRCFQGPPFPRRDLGHRGGRRPGPQSAGLQGSGAILPAAGPVRGPGRSRGRNRAGC